MRRIRSSRAGSSGIWGATRHFPPIALTHQLHHHGDEQGDEGLCDAVQVRVPQQASHDLAQDVPATFGGGKDISRQHHARAEVIREDLLVRGRQCGETFLHRGYDGREAVGVEVGGNVVELLSECDVWGVPLTACARSPCPCRSTRPCCGCS